MDLEENKSNFNEKKDGKSLLFFVAFCLHIIVFLMAGSLHDSTLEKQYSAFNCDDRVHAYDIPERCDVGFSDNESEFKWLNYCCFSMMILLPLFILKDKSPLERETSIKNVWKTAQEIPWMIILTVLISAIIGSISIVKENNFMNEQFDEIETNNYSNWELKRLHFEEAEFSEITMIFMATSMILVMLFNGILLMDEPNKSNNVMISKKHEREWFVDSEKYQSKHVHKKEAKYFNSNEKQLKDKIKQLENSLLSHSKNRDNKNQKLRNELLQLKADYESLKKSKNEINVNQTVVYNISDSVISGDQSLNNEININSDKEN